MDIELFYFEGCPNWHLTHERLAKALNVTGRSGQKVRLRSVDTNATAQALRFSGSPTIRIDGQDPFPAPGESYGLACRLYATPRRARRCAHRGPARPSPH
ncbi:hypothetical protein GCM10011583_64240 [Streptomyces camponoticapitis]|uniref:Alkylmercury lyase n=1 Tax=Streptomyces camponoticapitis TaxID=1616125 RepID=A0ABQ2ESD5_9ACTN|nr:hypothetical protein GCM10011583_64240 [Streptomyces camponoticapitis]